tara:strand:+ start:5124 stop:9290 length:4167 start_codon:yes stop_codon:yes gene_type:complete
MNSFVKETAKYFQTFLETDFRKRRLPKRSINATNKYGNKILVNLDKYRSFRSVFLKQLKDHSNFDFEIEIKPRQYITTIQGSSTELIIKTLTDDLGNKENNIKNSFKVKLQEEYINFVEDVEKFFESCTNQVIEILSQEFFKNSTSVIHQTLNRISETESSGNYEIENQLSEILFEKQASLFHETLLNFASDKQEDVFDSFFKSLLAEEEIVKVIQDYFESFSITDLYQDLFILEKEIKTKDNFEGYIYIGELKFNDKYFPISFIPMEIDVSDSNKILIKFEKRYFINKQAIEYVYQNISENRNVAGLSGIIGDRTINLDEGEDIATDIENLLAKLSSRGFNIADTFSQGLNLTNVIENDRVKIRNSILFAVADKGDESAVNDYEEILGMLDSEEGLFQELEKLVESFLSDNPENVGEEIRKEWSDLPTEERLVYKSPIPVNEEQRKIIQAVKSDKSRFITVQGPPGTGKSHTISAILFEAINNNSSVLLLSDKKEALDVVEDKLTETLNKVRPDENFQNPILRIGKTGNTYAKILSPQSIENIRLSYETTKQVLEKNPNELKKEISSLQDGIKETISNYKKIDLHKISKHFSLQKELKFEVTDDGEVQNKHYLNDLLDSNKNFEKLLSYLKKIKKIKLDLNEKELNSFNKFRENLKDYPADNFYEFLDKFSSKTTNYKLETLSNHFDSFDEKDSEFLKSAIKEYNSTISTFFGKIFKTFYLSSWQKEIINNLSIRGVAIDFRKNIKILSNYKDLLDSIQKEKEEFKNKFMKFINDEEMKLYSKDKYKKIFSNVKKFDEELVSLQNKIKLSPDHIEAIKIDSFESIDKTHKDEILFLEKLTDFLKVTEEINKNFNSIKDIRFLDNSRDIQQDTAIEMTQEFDKRFLEFQENNKNDAKTFKNIISKKLRFPKKDFHKIKNAFPCIIAGIRDYAEYIPLDKHVFDLLIIDEASQVSIAQAFPAIVRAKKILVLGDNKQFSNVKSTTASNDINNSFINSLKQSASEEFGDDPLKLERAKVFNVRTSILDFFEYTSNYNALLKKHFRGYPELISFSSKYFYDGSLQALKIRAKPIEEVIEFKKLDHDGLLEIKGNVNSIEAKEIRYMLEEKIKSNSNMSVGVITPFRDQQRFILGEIDNSEFRSEIYTKLKLKVMTFDTCQGEERDHIIYSFVEYPNGSSKSSYVLGSKFEESMDPEQNIRLQRLNVGMSRAKEKMTFLLSQNIESFNGNGKMILNHYKDQLNKAKDIPDASNTESPMEKKLLHWITQTSFYQKYSQYIEIQAQFDVSKYIKSLDPSYDHPNYRCDFLIIYRDEANTKSVIVEYDGFEFHFHNSSDINQYNYEHYYLEDDVERERILESYGFPFIRFNKFNLGNDPVETISKKFEGFFLPNQ